MNQSFLKILKYAESLRFHWLVLLTGLLFVADVIVPDIIPFADEIADELIQMAQLDQDVEEYIQKSSRFLCLPKERVVIPPQ